MTKFRISAAALMLALAGIGSTGSAYAADMPIATKAQAAPAATPVPAPPGPCASVPDFFLTSCVLSYYGITVYGAVDVGAGWQSHGAPFNPQFVTGASYLIQKMNNKPMWGLAPNGMGQSFVGIKANWPLLPGPGGVSFVGAIETGFDPYSLRLANSPGSMFSNQFIPGNLQSTNGDSSRAGQWNNGQSYAGLSQSTLGTLTYGRHNTLGGDANCAYDPMSCSYAFSPIGFSGNNAGFGFTENARWNDSLRYRVNYGWFRAAAMVGLGGYDQGNANTAGSWQAGVGADIPLIQGWGTISVDAIYNQSFNDVFLSLQNNLTGAAVLDNQVTARLANINALMLVGKYTNGPLSVYAGYTHDLLSDPNIQQMSSLAVINGDTILQGALPSKACNLAPGKSSSGCFLNMQFYAGGAELLQSFWTGVKYSITPTLDVIGAYYLIWNNEFGPGTTAGLAAGCNANSTFKSQCSGALEAFSAVIDWRFAPKWDVYFGLMYSQVSGGQASAQAGTNGTSFIQKNNIDPTVGLRFRF
jgi:predicted porin